MQRYNFNDLSSESSDIQQEIPKDDGIYVEEQDENVNPEEAQQVLEVDQNIEIQNPNAPDPSNYNNISPNLNAYKILESYPTIQPCLTLDTIYTNKFQDVLYVLGTYTQKQAKNQIQIVKVSNLKDEDLDEDEPSDTEIFQQVQFTQRNIDVPDNVLRVKSATHFCNNQIQGHDNIIACITDKKQLLVINAQNEVNQLIKDNQQVVQQQAQIQQIDLPSNGFGIDILPEKQVIIVGLQDSSIYCFKYTDNQILQDKTNYCRIQGSVEDVRFNHINRGLFAACSTSGEVQITNIQNSDFTQNTQIIKISDCDLNVLDWDYFDSNILYVGDDKGSVYVLNCQNFNQIQVVKKISWQKSPITSLKANPQEAYQIATSDDNGGVLIYQIDAQEDQQIIDQGLFSEYLFLHCGMTEPRELTWCIKKDVVGVVDIQGIQIFKGKIEEDDQN